MNLRDFHIRALLVGMVLSLFAGVSAIVIFIGDGLAIKAIAAGAFFAAEVATLALLDISGHVRRLMDRYASLRELYDYVTAPRPAAEEETGGEPVGVTTENEGGESQ